MKKLMITGGLMGFLIGVTFGLATKDSNWSGILLRASVAALVGGWLFRWWGGVLVRSLHEMQQEQLHVPAKAGENGKSKLPWEK